MLGRRCVGYATDKGGQKKMKMKRGEKKEKGMLMKLSRISENDAANVRVADEIRNVCLPTFFVCYFSPSFV